MKNNVSKHVKFLITIFFETVHDTHAFYKTYVILMRNRYTDMKANVSTYYEFCFPCFVVCRDNRLR